jgi:hypothetical protein
MRKALLCSIFLVACEPGKVVESNDDSLFFEWEEGDEAPRIANGHIYCQFDAAEFFVFYINVTADDPQGASDIKDGLWRAFDPDEEDALVDDVLVCDGSECLYSFHAEQYPEIACELLSNYRFEAEIFDWQGNSTGSFDLLILEGPPEE